MENPDTFGALFGRLMVERRARRLTQGQLAALVWPGDSNAEVTRKGDISKIERGKVANPQATTVAKIAAALEISDPEVAELRRRALLTPAQQLDEVPTLTRNQSDRSAIEPNDIGISEVSYLLITIDHGKFNPGEIAQLLNEVRNSKIGIEEVLYMVRDRARRE